MVESGGMPTSSDVADLAALWRVRLQSIETLLSELGGTRLEVELTDHAQLIQSLLKRQDYEEIIGMVELWSWPRTAERLTRLRAYAEGLATRLGKSVQITIEHNDVRMPREYLEKFWTSLVHVVRNAVDHASEPAEVRIAQGKPPQVQLVFVTMQTEQSLLVEIRDDGPGVDREALLRSPRVVAQQLAADSSSRTWCSWTGCRHANKSPRRRDVASDSLRSSMPARLNPAR